MKLFVKPCCEECTALLQLREDSNYPLDVLTEEDNPEVFEQCDIRAIPALVMDDGAVLYCLDHIEEEIVNHYEE